MHCTAFVPLEGIHLLLYIIVKRQGTKKVAEHLGSTPYSS